MRVNLGRGGETPRPIPSRTRRLLDSGEHGVGFEMDRLPQAQVGFQKPELRGCLT
jgi:hypothetical protein